jgi:hypothetical protein
MALNCQLLLSESKQKVSDNLIHPKTKKNSVFQIVTIRVNTPFLMSPECPLNYYFLFMTFKYGPSFL